MHWTAFLAWLGQYKYVVIFLLTLLQGPAVMTLSGFFLRLGTVQLIPIYIVLMAADLTGDTLWYGIGYYYAHPFAKKYGRFVGLSESALAKAETVFNKYHNRILFLSKISMGLGFALVILMTAGMTRVPFKKYIAFNALGQVVWTGLLLAAGYFFGDLYLVINSGLRDVTLVAGAIILIAIIYGFGRYMRQRMLLGKL